MKALLLNGQSHHGWLASSPLVKKILEQTGLFSVDVKTRPPKGSDMSGFRPEFEAYDLIVLDDGGDPWSDSTNAAFVDYISAGGSVALFHHSCQLFPQWQEFNEIMGLAGWGKRPASVGPRLYWRDGEVVRDTGPGDAGDCLDLRENQIIVRDPAHPITKGLPQKWLHAADELYFNLRGPAKNLHVLATAYVEPQAQAHYNDSVSAAANTSPCYLPWTTARVDVSTLPSGMSRAVHQPTLAQTLWSALALSRHSSAVANGRRAAT